MLQGQTRKYDERNHKISIHVTKLPEATNRHANGIFVCIIKKHRIMLKTYGNLC